MTDLVERFPALNSMLKKINYRKTRDQMIMAGVCSTCIIFILWYVGVNVHANVRPALLCGVCFLGCLLSVV